MCDVFICSDSGVGLCEDDRKLLEGLGSTSNSSSSKGSCDKKVKFDDIELASEDQPCDKSAVEEIEEGDGNNNKEAEEDRNRKENKDNKESKDNKENKENKESREGRNNRESVEKVGCAGKISAPF